MAAATASGILDPRMAATGMSTTPAAAAAVGVTPWCRSPAVAHTSSQSGAMSPTRRTTYSQSGRLRETMREMTPIATTVASAIQAHQGPGPGGK